MANGGKLMKPRIVKEIRNSEGEIISKIENGKIKLDELENNKIIGIWI